MTASKLLHRCAYSRDVVELDSDYVEDDPVYTPSAGRTYSFTPFFDPEDGWVPRYVLGAYVQTSVEVFVGSTSFVIWNNLRMDLDWTTVPGWEDGW